MTELFPFFAFLPFVFRPLPLLCQVEVLALLNASVIPDRPTVSVAVLRSCVKVELAFLASPSLIVLMFQLFPLAFAVVTRFPKLRLSK